MNISENWSSNLVEFTQEKVKVVFLSGLELIGTLIQANPYTLVVQTRDGKTKLIHKHACKYMYVARKTDFSQINLPNNKLYADVLTLKNQLVSIYFDDNATKYLYCTIDAIDLYQYYCTTKAGNKLIVFKHAVSLISYE